MLNYVFAVMVSERDAVDFGFEPQAVIPCLLNVAALAFLSVVGKAAVAFASMIIAHVFGLRFCADPLIAIPLARRCFISAFNDFDKDSSRGR